MKPHTTRSDDPSILTTAPLSESECQVVRAALREWGDEMSSAIDNQQTICGGEPISILEGSTIIRGKTRRFKLTFAMADERDVDRTDASESTTPT